MPGTETPGTGTTRQLLAALLASGLLVGVFTTAAATPVLVQWAPALDLSDPGLDAGEPELAGSADGTRLTAVWRRSDGTHQIIQTRSSTDAGATWTPAANLSDPGSNARDPQVATSDDGVRMATLWRRGDGTHERIQTRSSTDAGATWTPVADLSEPGESAYAPQIATSADGTRLTAVWRRSDGTHQIVQTRSSADAGATWTPVADLSEPGGNAYAPQITVSADGTRLTAVWYRFNGTRRVIQSRSSTDGGATWRPVATLSDPAQNAYAPRVATSADGTRLTAVWHRFNGANGIVQTRSSGDSGASWSPVANLSEPGQNAYEPQVTSSADGTRLTAAWRRNDGAHWRIQTRSSADGGGAWTPVADLSIPGRNAERVRLAASDDGNRVTAVWHSFGSTDARVEFSSSADAGATWTPQSPVANTGQLAGPPQLVASTTGTRVTATWNQKDGELTVRAAAGSLSTLPGAPSRLRAKPKPGTAKIVWSPPVDDGNSPITQYTAVFQPGGFGCATIETSCTLTGLPNFTTYTVTVTASNAVGTGPATAPVEVTPALKAVAIATPIERRSRLRVRVKPDLGPKKQWKFTVSKKVDGQWKVRRTRSGKDKVYKTAGPKHIRIVNLKKGRYKARSIPARGYLPDNSKVVKLRR